MLKDNTEQMAIIGAMTVAIVSLIVLGVEAKEIALGVGIGFIGYLSRQIKND
jgi:hypothetical protein